MNVGLNMALGHAKKIEQASENNASVQVVSAGYKTGEVRRASPSHEYGQIHLTHFRYKLFQKPLRKSIILRTRPKEQKLDVFGAMRLQNTFIKYLL